MNRYSERQEGPEERGRGRPVSAVAGREGGPVCRLSERTEDLFLRSSPPLGVSGVYFWTV